MIFDDRLNQMVAMAEKAGDLAREIRADPNRLRVEEKGHLDLVTAADHAVEAYLRDEIDKVQPDATVLGEENGLVVVGESSDIWIVDPIDGTVNFSRGMPDWAISIACFDGEKLTHGVIHAPDLNLTAAGQIGNGAALNGRTTRFENIDQPTPLVSLGYSPRMSLDDYLSTIRELLDQGIEHRRHGAATIGLLGVFAGWFDAYFEAELNIWDAAAGLVLIEAAGGSVRHEPFAKFLGNCSPVLACSDRSIAQLDWLFENSRTSTT